MGSRWRDALANVAARLNRGGIDWLLVGSAATALRGVAVEPGDLDIAVASPGDVGRAATFLPTPDAGPSGSESDSSEELWLSTTATQTLQFGDVQRWTFGRWIVDGVTVELAHIEDPAVAGLMIETDGSLVWERRSILDCLGERVPTVPIEVQLATMLAREQTARIEATLAIVSELRLDAALLHRAITDKEAEGFTLSMPAPLSDLLVRRRATAE